MKNLKTIAIALLLTVGITSVNAQSKKVDASTSTINWVGKKLTGSHSGTINLKEGSLDFKSNKLTGGSFVVDMNSIVVTDIKAGQGKENLEGHLKNDDFFATDKFATAALKFTKVATTKTKNVYNVTGDMTIKGITKPVTFALTVNGNKATAKVIIDRTKYGIEYKSGSIFQTLGDKAINDDFELEVALNF